MVCMVYIKVISVLNQTVFFEEGKLPFLRISSALSTIAVAQTHAQLSLPWLRSPESLYQCAGKANKHLFLM